MFKKELALMAILCTFWACNLQAEQINSTWVGSDEGSWDNTTNWIPPIVPDNNSFKTFNVTISTAQRTRIRLPQPRTINQLDSYENVDLEDGAIYNRLTLTEPNGLTNHGRLEISGEGEHNIFGNFLNTTDATLFLSDQTTEFHGGFANHGSITISGISFSTDGGNFTNSGTILTVAANVSIDSSVDNTENGTITGSGLIHSNSSVQNWGTISAWAGTLLVYPEESLTNLGILENASLAVLNVHSKVDVNNQGRVEVNAGGGVAFDCNVVNEPNGIIKLLGGTLAATKISQEADANFTGFGGITGNIVIDPNGIIKLTGPTNIVGDVEIKPDATLEISDGTTLITGQTTCNGTIHMKGGYIIPQGGLTGDCHIIWEPGTYTNIADFNLDGKVNFGDFAYFADTWLWESGWR